MDSQQLSELNLEDDFNKILGLDEARHWGLQHPSALEVRATTSPKNSLNEFFVSRFLWNVYPQEPPSLKFIDPQTGRLDLSSAWPMLPGFRPSNLDACVNWTLEGFTLHPEWKNDPRYRWDPRGNVLLKVLRYLQNELDLNFQGRSK